MAARYVESVYCIGNSLLFHIDEVRILIRDLGLHILAISETKLDDSVDDALLSIDGYSVRRCDRNRKGGGAAALDIKDTILDKCYIC